MNLRVTIEIDISLNAPQGFMLIPTFGNYIYPQFNYSLNAPQGFMLIPTANFIGANLECAWFGLNAPQGFMLIPTEDCC